MKGSKKLSVRQLRELARKHIRRGHSKLKTKAELTTALKKWLGEIPQPPSKPPKKKKAGPHAKRTARAEVVTFVRADQPLAAAVSGAARPAEPIIEGFFVARVAGEGEARRHHLVEEAERGGQPGAWLDEGVADLPSAYEDDCLRALPRDPHTLFVWWDFHPRTRESAAAGLEAPRSVLRVYEGESLAREVEMVLEARSFYLNGLTPGRQYRVEAHWVGADGRSKQIGPASDAVALPHGGEEPRRGEARFAAVSWNPELPGADLGLGAARVLSEQEVEALAGEIPRARSRGVSASDSSRWTAPSSGRP
jgi:hypothetical protein